MNIPTYETDEQAQTAAEALPSKEDGCGKYVRSAEVAENEKYNDLQVHYLVPQNVASAALIYGDSVIDELVRDGIRLSVQKQVRDAARKNPTGKKAEKSEKIFK